MSGYDLPIQNENEREWYANVGRIQERQRIIKLLEGADSACSEWAIALIEAEK